MNKLVSRLKRLILNPTKKELVFLSVGAAVLLIFFIFILVKINQPKSNTQKTVSKIKVTSTSTKKPTPTGKTTKTPTPTIKKYTTLIPTTRVIPTSTPTTAPTSVPNTPTPTVIPTRVPNPPKMKINSPTNGGTVEGSQICVADVPDPDNAGDQSGLKRKQNFDRGTWPSYADMTTLCYSPKEGSNTLELQYKNSHEEESQIYEINFTFHRTN